METAKGPGTFISYSHKDKGFALKLAKELRSASFPIWLDQLSIPTGARWDDEIENALHACETFLVILTPASIASESVKDEIGYAIDHGKRILPVLLEECEVPFRLRRFQYVDFTKLDFRAGVRRAKRLLENLTLDSAEAEGFDFWEGLSEKVMIVFGAIENPKKDKDGHSVISLRDLKAAQTIEAYLHKRFPQKKIGVLTATTKGWQFFLPEDTDLIVIGGWVVNEEFKNHQAISRKSVRLKMGRICRVEGQRVFHVDYHDPSLRSLRSQPHKIEQLSSRDIKEDFGYVSDTREEIYGSNRRVISIAGIKGNGTLGAASHLTHDMTSELRGVSTFKNDPYRRLELIIKAQIREDVIYQREIVEVIVDGKPRTRVRALVDGKPGKAPVAWLACELKRSCEKCTFGESMPEDPRLRIPPAGRTKIESIIVDLDDTLLDTFSTLIVPLEIAAAKQMVHAGGSPQTVDDLAALFLQLRRSDPANMEIELKKQFSDEMLVLRRSVAEGVNRIDLSHLVMNPEIRIVLRDLKAKCRLFLLTEGNLDFQNAKIDQLGIREYFTKIVTVSAPKDTKKRAISALVKECDLDKSSTLIVGNRLDKEILAGNQLGIKTVWIRHGEGSKMTGKRDGEIGVPDYVFDSILELRDGLKEILPT